ncbi:DgyrCDS9553 [Dimorphilus gyrociliatus]|nr:DgyrCDS9553 [Dimorphilus gyrociliatus]
MMLWKKKKMLVDDKPVAINLRACLAGINAILTIMNVASLMISILMLLLPSLTNIREKKLIDEKMLEKTGFAMGVSGFTIFSCVIAYLVAVLANIKLITVYLVLAFVSIALNVGLSCNYAMFLSEGFVQISILCNCPKEMAEIKRFLVILIIIGFATTFLQMISYACGLRLLWMVDVQKNKSENLPSCQTTGTPMKRQMQVTPRKIKRSVSAENVSSDLNPWEVSTKRDYFVWATPYGHYKSYDELALNSGGLAFSTPFDVYGRQRTRSATASTSTPERVFCKNIAESVKPRK